MQQYSASSEQDTWTDVRRPRYSPIHFNIPTPKKSLQLGCAAATAAGNDRDCTLDTTQAEQCPATILDLLQSFEAAANNVSGRWPPAATDTLWSYSVTKDTDSNDPPVWNARAGEGMSVRHRMLSDAGTKTANQRKRQRY